MLQGMRAIAIGYTEKTVDDKEELPRLRTTNGDYLSDTIRNNTKKH